jgi:ABC-type multidrug transport system fused ATPase/permease subunit
MKTTATRSLAATLSLATALLSLQPAVPAAAQVIGAAESAARAGMAAQAGAAVPVAGMEVRPLMTVSPAASLAPALTAVPSAPSAALEGSVVPSAVSPSPVAESVAVPVAAVNAIAVPSAPSSIVEKSRVSTKEMGPAASAKLFTSRPAVEIDGTIFDGSRRHSSLSVHPAASAPAEEKSSVEGAATPARPSALKRFLVRPLRAAASPAVAVWRKVSGGTSAALENATWARAFWSRLRAEGVDVRADLWKASGLALAIAAVSLVPSWLYGQMAQHLHDLQGLAGPVAGVSWWQVPVLRTFAELSGALIVVHSAAALLSRTQSLVMYGLGNKLMKGVSDLFVNKVLGLDMRWQNSRSVGDVVSTATDAIYTLQSTASAMIVDLVRNGAVALIAGGAMLWVSASLSAFTIPFLIFALSIPSSLYGHRVQQAYRSFFAMKKPRFAGALQEIAANILKVKSSGLEARELAKMREHSHQTYIVGGGEIARVAAPQRALAGGLTDVARVIVMGAAVAAVYLGAMPVAAAVTYIFLSNYFRDAMQSLTGLWVSLKSMRGAAARYDKIMALAPEDLHDGGVVLPETATGRGVELRGVRLRYTADGAPVLKGVDLDIKPGEMVGFVGMTGGGKTTTAMSVLGLYPLDGGEIRIDGVPLEKLDLRALRREVGAALQDSIPFAGTIRENIAYLRQDASEAEIRAAARAAGLDGQIRRFGADRALDAQGAEGADADAIRRLSEALPAVREALRASLPEGQAALIPDAPLDAKKGLKENAVGASGAEWEAFEAAARAAGVLDAVATLGYGARVGERGLNMSGGQKQRLMLAQLFVQPDKPFGLMIYDEPTSALDGRTQALVEDQIAARRGKSTQIVIAHRLSNVQRADRIVVFADGQVVEQGTHAELMRRGGVYAKMWDAQRLLDAASQDGGGER